MTTLVASSMWNGARPYRSIVNTCARSVNCTGMGESACAFQPEIVITEDLACECPSLAGVQNRTHATVHTYVEYNCGSFKIVEYFPTYDVGFDFCVEILGIGDVKIEEKPKNHDETWTCQAISLARSDPLSISPDGDMDDHHKDKSKSLSTTALIGILAGAIIVAALVSALFIQRRRRRQQQQAKTNKRPSEKKVLSVQLPSPIAYEAADGMVEKFRETLMSVSEEYATFYQAYIEPSAPYAVYSSGGGGGAGAGDSTASCPPDQCPNCCAWLSDDAIFCSRCGIQVCEFEDGMMMGMGAVEVEVELVSQVDANSQKPPVMTEFMELEASAPPISPANLGAAAAYRRRQIDEEEGEELEKEEQEMRRAFSLGRR